MHASSPRAALVAVDLQNDFMPGGALGVADGDDVIAPLNRAMRAAAAGGMPIFLTRTGIQPTIARSGSRRPVAASLRRRDGRAAFAEAVDVMPRAVIV
jgi:nicotinamidase/pyrazinamidase